MNGIPNRVAHTPKTPLIVPQRVIDRVMNKVLKGSEDGCHISLYSVASHGYAQIGWHEDGVTRGTLAHRVAWISEHGPIPHGMTIDHTCKTKRCINIKHLRILDNFENGRRTDGRDWPLGQCVNGHPDSELRLSPNGAGKPMKLKCWACNRDAQARYRAKVKARRTAVAA